MAQNAEQEGRGAEHQNLDMKLNAEWDTERIVGTVETAWEKVAVGNKAETEMKKTTAQTEKKTVEMQKRTVETQKRTVETQKRTVETQKRMVETQKRTVETQKRTVETQKRTVEMQKRTVMKQTAEGTRKTAVVNKKTEGESLYQNCRNTHQTDGRAILYILKQKKLNQEQEPRLVY
jgi:hypothetical protein